MSDPNAAAPSAGGFQAFRRSSRMLSGIPSIAGLITEQRHQPWIRR